MKRILVFGNSGSGKTTLARALARGEGLPHLDLDGLAWDEPAVRRPLAASAAAVRDFLAAHEAWVIEGCYGDLLEVAAPFCSEMRFLNPGVDACVANCRRRPWEPEKYGSKEEQDANLEFLLDWVRQYESREDEYSLRRHRAIFDDFHGPKEEITSVT